MRLLRLIIILFVLTGTAITGAQVIGTSHPPPSIAAIFTNPDGSACEQPCMFGIKPHSTRLTEMLQIIDRHPLLRGLKLVETTGGSVRQYQLSDSNHNIVVILDTSDTVQTISWGNKSCNPSWLPSVADIIDILGNPSLAWVQPVIFGTTTYVYTNYHIEIESVRENRLDGCKNSIGKEILDPDDIVLGIFVDSGTYSTSVEYGLPWQGFRQAQVYANEMR